MYYFELIQRFWQFNKENQVGSTAISMYLYLLKIGYDEDRYDFQISDVAISQELGLTRKTVKSTKEKLKNLGLIQFQTKNGIPCNYRLILDYPLQISERKKVKKQEIKKEEFIQKEEEFTFPSQTVSSIQILSENTNQEVEVRSSQSSREKISNKNIPSWKEFIEFAQTLEIYEPQLDFEIQSKYQSWKNNGWKNNADRPINNWKSSLKSTLPFMKKTSESNTLILKSIPNIERPKSQNENY